MEVHHHPHVAKKSFKEYLLEFIMIFLAVTLGFFAESLREHIADKKKEKQIILALKKDLEKDTIRLHHLIDDYIPTFHSWIDSSHNEIDSLPLKGNERKICKSLFNSTYWELYTPPAIAQSTLKDPFTFNLIKNEQVKTEMLNYNANLNNFIMYSEFLSGLRHSIDTSFVSLVNRQDIRKLLDRLAINNYFLNDSDIPNSVQFKTYDKAMFKNFLTKLDQIDFKTKDLLSFYRDILNGDIQLLRLFRDQYHIN
ncbi:MAG: hypothetical protein JST17_05840 [Bacteroidetes bacterium]|nr:hypothetical protein [Bacteroidota bacterium]MBS1929921.1 hypothetical protein [Bacteroidota bacterium]